VKEGKREGRDREEMKKKGGKDWYYFKK